MCGDHFISEKSTSFIGGSPPHVRGPHKIKAAELQAQGITPACAGTTDQGEDAEGELEDHPRMCGDHRHNEL